MEPVPVIPLETKPNEKNTVEIEPVKTSPTETKTDEKKPADKTSGNKEPEGTKDKNKESFKTYNEIKKILTDSFGINNPETISEKQLKILVSKFGKGKLSDKDVAMFISVRASNRKYEKLTIPDLPKDKTLTMAEMQSVGPINLDKRLEIVSGTIKDTARAPIDFSEMKASDWMKVIVNCNMIYGRIFGKLGNGISDLAEEPMFFPPNESLFGTPDFKVSQVALSFWQKSELEENFNDKSIMTSFTVGASFSTPWVSGSAEYSHDTQDRTVEKDSVVKSVFKVEVPIGVFTLPRPSELEYSKMKLNDNFRSFVTKYLKNHPNCTRAEIQKAMTLRFGDIVPRSVKIGVACYTEQTTTAKEKQTLNSVSDGFKVSVTAAYGGFGGGASTSHSKTDKSEEGKKSQKNAYVFTAIAGSLPDPKNPMSIADFRLLPNSWRIIDFGDEFTPVFEYFDKETKEILNKLENNYGNFYPGIALTKDQGLREPVNSKYKMMLEEDGNLVINRYFKFYYSVWRSETAKTNASVLRFADDGNLILSDPEGKELWSSKTGGKGIDKFSLLHDGNFVAYSGDKVVWQTDTADKIESQFFKGKYHDKGNGELVAVPVKKEYLQI